MRSLWQKLLVPSEFFTFVMFSGPTQDCSNATAGTGHLWGYGVSAGSHFLCHRCTSKRLVFIILRLTRVHRIKQNPFMFYVLSFSHLVSLFVT